MLVRVERANSMLFRIMLIYYIRTILGAYQNWITLK